MGFEFDTFEIFNDTIGGGAIAVPEWPPAAVWFGEGGVSRRAGKEMTLICAVHGW